MNSMAVVARLVMFVLIPAALPSVVSTNAVAQTSASAPIASEPSAESLKPEQLDQLVAPIALHPDALLSQMLIASTYPLELVQAERWLKQNKDLKGDQLKAAVGKQSWDDSVKSLVAVPEVLTMMSTNLDWTQNLGNAVLAQQADVMDAIQRLRKKAQANNKLVTTKEQKVTTTQVSGEQTLVIEPVEPETIHVPYYDPASVYGDWEYPAYPPYYFPPAAGYLASGVVLTGIAFGAGYALGRWTARGNYWGGGFNWGGNNINTNRPVNISTGNVNNWTHNSVHRHGVKYTNANVQQKFGKANIGSGNERLDFRGHSGDQVLRPDRDRASLGDQRPGGDRSRAGDRSPGRDRPGSAAKPKDRPGGAKRPQRDTGFSNIHPKNTANAQSNRGKASVAARGGAPRVSAPGHAPRAGATARSGMPRAGAAAAGGSFRGGARGGRRSDINLKHNIVLLGRLENGLGFYRFMYRGNDKVFVGVMAQEVQAIAPDAVVRGRDGSMRVLYEKLGIELETYDHWMSSGARIPSAAAAISAR